MTDVRTIARRDQIGAASRAAASGVDLIEAQAVRAGEPVGRFDPFSARAGDVTARMLDALGDVPRDAICRHLSFRRPAVCFWPAWSPQRLLCAECAELATKLASADCCDVCGERGGATWAVIPSGAIVLMFTACPSCLTSG
jgi:hypothetical protein